MNKKIFTILLIMCLILGSIWGCNSALVGSGNLKTEEYSVHDFYNVEISSAFEFEIMQSSSYSVSITADDNVFDKLKVTTEDNTLKIGLETIISFKDVTLKAVVTMPELHSLVASGASHGTVSEFSSSDAFDITLSGASKLDGDITAGNVDFNISGASTIQLEGTANNINANVSGASHLNLDNFLVNDADVNFSGASSGTINPSGRLDAQLSGASNLWYIGEPIMGTINTSGLSKINKK